jgi:succinyl-diaminopimelate desuccinylase
MGYLERIDGYKEDILRDLADSLSFPSVACEPVMTAEGEFLPFGRPVHDSLMHMLECGRKLGFDSVNLDNKAGYIEFRAADQENAGRFDIVGHLDVVPEGTGWTGDPYVMREKDGYLYGRGVSDDKGPVIASLYAMKALKDEGIVPDCNIRLVLGLNEEVGEESIDYYTERCGHPDMGFTPDGDFPVVNGEMGILVFDLAQKLRSTPSKTDLRLTRLEAGTAHNMVPGRAKAVIAGDKQMYDIIADRASLFCKETGYVLTTKKTGSSLVVEAIGKAAHGARPQLGTNALSIMMEFLGGIKFACEDLNDFIAFYNEHLGFDIHGERLGCNFADNHSGPLILNTGVAIINEELATVSVNIRYPVTCTDTDVLSGIETALEGTDIGLITHMVQTPVFLPLDSPMVTGMLKAYTDETGDHDTPAIVQPGGTYAKMVNNILCFGGMFPGEPDTMHQVDEMLSMDSLMKMTRIYARTLMYTCCK